MEPVDRVINGWVTSLQKVQIVFKTVSSAVEDLEIGGALKIF